ncbi:MAG: nucleotide 5'-monophosphate nucleosidase PpnN [Methylococcales bacterium]
MKSKKWEILSDKDAFDHLSGDMAHSVATVDAEIAPTGSLEVLSRFEMERLLDSTQGGLYQQFRSCVLAVLNCGSPVDDSREIMEQFKSFGLRILQQKGGIRLELTNAPGSAFVDDEIILGINEHVFAVLRDIVYTGNEIVNRQLFDLVQSADITNAVFRILRNADVLKATGIPDIVVCWGGHSIGRMEYDYAKEVGYELGLRGLNICTGCGAGVMKAPMKGATIAHAKQRILNGRYLGITEPGIIAAESPNPIVNDLVIMPDIEKRLEAFVRVGHAVIVFPGGVGTAEEILYLLGILLHPENNELSFPLIFTGPEQSAEYFDEIDKFIGQCLGKEAQQRYKIIIGHPMQVARKIKEAIGIVRHSREVSHDAYYFNWLLKIEEIFQVPFEPTHENMANLELHHDQPAYRLAANLRRAFSGIVAGNVKDEGIRAIEEHGPFEIKGEQDIMRSLENLLTSFIKQKRMKLPIKEYVPCYRVVG